MQPPLPDGDILIHAGDLTQSGTSSELSDVLEWLNAQPHPYKLVIAGNHDHGFADEKTRQSMLEKYPGVIYLQDNAVEFIVQERLLRVYGSPYTPKHGSWVFQYPRFSTASTSTVPAPPVYKEETSDWGDMQTEAVRRWRSIPLTTDILITHGPPMAHLDLQRGCIALLDALWRVRPLVHVFGHIHAARGVEKLFWGNTQRVYEDICTRRNRWRWWGLLKLI
jgi:hypothetical protein